MNDVVSRRLMAIMSRHNLLPCLLLLYSCILLKMEGSNVSNSSEIISNSSREQVRPLALISHLNSSEIISNSSREQVRPLALISHLNRSTADLFILEANSMFVSNTSFDDLVSNNDTHQMFLRYRERKRQVRLRTIQQEILHKLGFDQEPNITSSSMSEQQRILLVSSFDKLQEISDANDTVIENDLTPGG